MTISNLFAILVFSLIVAIPIGVIVLIGRLISRKPCKQLGIAIVVGIGLFIVYTCLGAFTDPATWCEHEHTVEVSRIEPTEDTEGQVTTRCEKCGHEEVTTID